MKTIGFIFNKNNIEKEINTIKFGDLDVVEKEQYKKQLDELNIVLPNLNKIKINSIKKMINDARGQK